MTDDSNCLDAESLIHELFTFHESDLHMKSKVVKIERRISLRRIDDSYAIERQRACCIPCAVHPESQQILKSGRHDGACLLPFSVVSIYLPREFNGISRGDTSNADLGLGLVLPGIALLGVARCIFCGRLVSMLRMFPLIAPVFSCIEKLLNCIFPPEPGCVIVAA
jgi:hypothetical protein